MNEMPVVAGEGLVGRVVQASKRRATVLLLTDPQSGVSVRLEKSGALGLANGRSGSDLLRLDLAEADTKVHNGELVFTSGRNISVYPANIPVGRVESVHKPAGALEPTVLVRPLVDIGRESFVRALEWPPRRGS
jgi:rod shape-determining protein MreC